MRKIVFVITKSQIGGAQKWVEEIREILKKDYELFLITSEPGWLSEKFPSENVKIIPQIGRLTSLTAIFYITCYLKKIKADVIISSSANAGIYSRLSRLFYPHKHIYVSHGWSCIYNGGIAKKLFCTIEKLMSYLCDIILCVSEMDKMKGMNIVKINESKLRVIRNAISPLKEKNFINKRKKIVYVGRMIRPKRPELLAEVAVSFPEIDFYFIGGGPDLETIANKYASHINIFFLGELSGFDSYNEFDIFVLTSNSEGLPMSALEAGSASLPLIMSNVGGCYELIFQNDLCQSNGMLINNNVDELTAAISNVISNYEKFYSAASQQKNKFDIKNVKSEYISLIEYLFDKKH